MFTTTNLSTTSLFRWSTKKIVNNYKAKPNPIIPVKKQLLLAASLGVSVSLLRYVVSARLDGEEKLVCDDQDLDAQV